MKYRIEEFIDKIGKQIGYFIIGKTNKKYYYIGECMGCRKKRKIVTHPPLCSECFRKGLKR